MWINRESQLRVNRPLVSRLAAHEPIPDPRTHAFSVGEPRNYAATQSSTGIPGDRNVGVIFLLWMRNRPRPLVYQGQQFYLKLRPTWLKSQDHSPRHSIDLFRSSSVSIRDQGKKPARHNMCSSKRWFSGGTLRIQFPFKRKENF